MSCINKKSLYGVFNEEMEMLFYGKFYECEEWLEDNIDNYLSLEIHKLESDDIMNLDVERD